MLVASPFQQWLSSGLLACYFVILFYSILDVNFCGDFCDVGFVLFCLLCFVRVFLLVGLFSFLVGWLGLVEICLEFGIFPLFLWLLV